MDIIKKLKSKKAIGSMASVLVGSIVLSTMVAATTEWYLSLKNNNNSVDVALEGQIVALNKWDEIVHQGLDEKETNVDKTDVSVDKYGHKITVEYGKRGAFKDGGKCVTSASQGEINSTFQTCVNVKIKVENKGGDEIFKMESPNVLSNTYSYPVGTIIPYTGNLEDIPSNWRLCDGQSLDNHGNPVPNLNGVYLKGTSTQEEIGQTGGNNTFKIQQENLPSAKFDISSNEYLAMGSYANPLPPDKLKGRIYVCDAQRDLYLTMHNLSTYIHIPDWKGEPFPVAPYHQTVAYIIKVS